MLKHKSFVINSGKKPPKKHASKRIQDPKVEAPKIATKADPVEASMHYDDNEPITLSLPLCLSSNHEEFVDDKNEGQDDRMENHGISGSQSYSNNEDSDDEIYSDANAYFEEEAGYSSDHAYQFSEDVKPEDKKPNEDVKDEELETHEAVVVDPVNIEDHESIAEQDKRFEEDIKAILTGKKQFDNARKQKNPEEALKEKNHGLMGKEGKDKIEEKLKNDHAIFDKIAQSMNMASSYDLGSIAMDKKFDTLEKETDQDFTKKIHDLLDLDDKDKKKLDEENEVEDPAKKEAIDQAETKKVDELKKKAEEQEKEEKVETKDFLKDLDKINEIEAEHNKEDQEKLSKQSSFNSTISIKHRHLKSRIFAVSGSTVDVMINSHWDPNNCSERELLSVSLTKNINNWPDSEKGTKEFRIGGPDTKTWTGLEPGDYYLTFFFATNTNPNCELKGTIEVKA